MKQTKTIYAQHNAKQNKNYYFISFKRNNNGRCKTKKRVSDGLIMNLRTAKNETNKALI